MSELTQLPLMFRFDRSDLMARATSLKGQFASAHPFPHVVIDDVLPPDVLEAVLEEFPEPREARWQTFDQATEVKLALADTTEMGPVTRHLLAEFNSQEFVEFIEELTGIDHLIPDPHYDGGGLHQIRKGGFLKVHADFNWHPGLQLYRRVNAILYLNKEWDPSYGGNLELWDTDMSARVDSVAPLFNRMLVFATLDNAYHGHPEPLTCPEDRARRSMALYYYTSSPSDTAATDTHSTLFKQRPGETHRNTARQSMKRWVPPAISDLIRDRRR
jgi:Rps23 Pro-64 3,4-dihydroxylase Tpa1-like proline 4-hydroxylase